MTRLLALKLRNNLTLSVGPHRARKQRNGPGRSGILQRAAQLKNARGQRTRAVKLIEDDLADAVVATIRHIKAVMRDEEQALRIVERRDAVGR